MMRSAKERVAILVAGVSLILLLASLLWLSGQASPVLAEAGTRHVAISGEDKPDCSDPADPCRTVQYAVDAASPQGLIKVAAGVYTGVNNYGGLAQVLHISQTVTVRGGYTTTGDYAGPPDPEANETTLDAEGQGGGVYITGTISPTLEGLRITGGDATGLGGGEGAWDAGGGVYVYSLPDLKPARKFAPLVSAPEDPNSRPNIGAAAALVVDGEYARFQGVVHDVQLGSLALMAVVRYRKA